MDRVFVEDFFEWDAVILLRRMALEAQMANTILPVGIKHVAKSAEDFQECDLHLLLVTPANYAVDCVFTAINHHILHYLREGHFGRRPATIVYNTAIYLHRNVFRSVRG